MICWWERENAVFAVSAVRVDPVRQRVSFGMLELSVSDRSEFFFFDPHCG
jgi:hypothetical protein